VTLEGNGDKTGWTRSLLGQNQIRFTGSWVIRVTNCFAVKQDNNVGVLLEGTG
jgi:hypothetical protein